MKRALLLVSFGVLAEASRARSLDALAEDFRQAFPAWTVRQAYTSRFLKAKLSERGVSVDSLPEALARLEGEGYDTVFVQPTYLTPGEEYEQKVCTVVAQYASHFAALLLGAPAFARPACDIRGLRAVEAAHAVSSGTQLVLLGHGSPHQHNPVYERLQAVVDEAGLPIHIGVLEPSDWPTFDDVLQRLRRVPAAEAGRILLAPLLLAGGRHVTRDMAGEDKDSWQSRLQAAGFPVESVLHGLGEYPAFRHVYIAQARDDLRAAGLL